MITVGLWYNINIVDGQKEKRFLDALESLFTGADVDGDSGFVNLMRMKRAYFRSIRPKLMEQIDQRAEKDSSFREELFDKLYTFFHRYFCESGSIYFRHLPAFSKIYERVYADGQDVALSWKTQMLYYVKSDVLVRSMPVELNEEGKPQHTRRFYFDASEVEHKKNNERREFTFAFGEVKREKEGRVAHLKVAYSRKGTKTEADEIIKQSRKAGIALTEEQLQKAIGVFRRQTEADFFINKDARGFLREQFDLWVYQYIFQEETIFEEKRIKQIQAIKNTAYNIIDFIAQFEDELRRVWEKPKFVRNVNYVVTLDKLTDKVLKKIIKHNGTKAQIKEWRELGMVDDKFSMKTIFNGQKSMDDKNGASGDWKFLPLDTKHLKDLELEILDGLGNLDEALDGELVHSENWQALNSLQRRYKERVKCIYIDPPYNTGLSEIIYKNSSKHSTWLTLIENRLEMSHAYQTTNGVLVVAIDENEQEALGLLLSKLFPKERKTAVTIVHNPSGQQGNNFSYCHDYAYFVYPDMKQIIRLEERSKNPDVRPLRDVSKGNHLRKDAVNCFYPIYIKDGKIIEIGDVCPNSFHPDSANIERDDGVVEVYPIDSKGAERKWVFSHDSVGKILDELKAEYNKNRKLWDIIRTKSNFNYKTVWTDKKYSANSYGSKLLNNILGEKHFDFPKSIYTVIECIKATENASFDSIILDYFAGSGTTAHAVINLNREDGGNRKYLLIEMGEYFHTVLLPRIKKVVYSKDWRDGTPVSREGSSHFLKYYTLEQYEETLKNARYEDGEQLELDSARTPFEQYVFFGDDKLAHAVKPSKKGKLNINIHDLYPDIDIAESLSNILGKSIRKRTTDTVTFKGRNHGKNKPGENDRRRKATLHLANQTLFVVGGVIQS